MAVLVPTTLAACGSGPTTYRNDDYRFSLTVEHRFEQRDSDAQLPNGVFAVAFADAGGARVGDRYVDGLVVAVVGLDYDLDADSTRKLQQQLATLAPQVARSLGGSGSTLPGKAVEINGLPGVVIPFAANVDGAAVVGRDYLLVRGRYVYAVVIMSRTDSWGANEPALEAAVRSFRVE